MDKMKASELQLGDWVQGYLQDTYAQIYRIFNEVRVAITTKVPTEDYISFETAKLLKEKGFDETCEYEYGTLNVDKSYVLQRFFKPIKNSELIDEAYAAPTLQMAMKWLREVHHYYIQVMLDPWIYGGHSGYYVTIQKTNSEFEIMLADKVGKVFYDNPEEAAEAAIKYCLENLI